MQSAQPVVPLLRLYGFFSTVGARYLPNLISAMGELGFCRVQTPWEREDMLLSL
jgi:hypothetical protein